LANRSEKQAVPAIFGAARFVSRWQAPQHFLVATYPAGQANPTLAMRSFRARNGAQQLDSACADPIIVKQK
jgi:hypothetical protein